MTAHCIFPRRLLALLTTLVVLCLFCGCQVHKGLSEGRHQPIRWRTLAEGKIEAEKRNVPVLVDFFIGEICHRCIMVQKEVYNEPNLAARIEADFVPVRIWLSNDLTADEKALSAQLNNGDECILAFLDPQGKVVKNIQGKQISSMGMLPAHEYVRYMDEALESIGRSPSPSSSAP